MAKTHARKFSGYNGNWYGNVYEEYLPLCGSRPTDPTYSENPDCLRCGRMLAIYQALDDRLVRENAARGGVSEP